MDNKLWWSICFLYEKSQQMLVFWKDKDGCCCHRLFSKIPIRVRIRTVHYPKSWLDTAALFKFGKSCVTIQNSHSVRPRLRVVRCPFVSADWYLQKRLLSCSSWKVARKQNCACGNTDGILQIGMSYISWQMRTTDIRNAAFFSASRILFTDMHHSVQWQ